MRGGNKISDIRNLVKILVLLSLFVVIVFVGLVIAENENIQRVDIIQCFSEDNAAMGNFTGPCDDPSGASLLFDDSSLETHEYKKNLYGGVKVQYANSSIEDCESISEVLFCYKWWRTNTANAINCSISIDADNGTSYTTINSTCPPTSEPVSIICNNVTGMENWTCSNFFGSSGIRAIAKSELTRVTSGGATTETGNWDVFYFNVTYNKTAPQVHVILNNTVKDAQNNTVSATIEVIDDDSNSTVYNGTILNNPLSLTKNKKYDIKIHPQNHKIKKLEFIGLNVTEDIAELIEIDDPTNDNGFNEIYAINPKIISNDTIFIVSTTASENSNMLYKCNDWNFTTQTCYGNWEEWMLITPGSDYTVTLNFADPGLAEGNGQFFEGFESGGFSSNNWTLSAASGANNWSVTNTNPYQGTYHAQAQPSSTTEPASILEVNVSTVNYTNITFSYYRKLVGLDPADEFKAKWFDGSVWTIVEETLSNSVDDSAYVFKSFSLPSSAANNPNFKIRFECTAGAASEYCRVDNVVVNGTSLIPPQNDTTVPVINSVSITPAVVVKGTEATITANVTDNLNMGSVWMKIDGEAQDYLMTRASLLTGNRTDKFSDDFELGTLNAKGWNVSGTGMLWAASSDNPLGGAHAAEARMTGAGQPSYMEKTIDTTGYQNITLGYYRKLIGIDVADEFAVEWYNGANWANLEATGDGSEDDSDYVYKEFNLSSAANNNPNFKIRFMCECRAVSEYCRVDNINLSAVSTGGSADLWKYTYITNASTAVGIYNFTIYANDSSGNNATPVSGNFSVIESNVTISESVTDPTGNPINITFEITDETNTTVYNKTSTVHNSNLPKGLYKIKLKPKGHRIKDISFSNTQYNNESYFNITRDISKLVVIEQANSSQAYYFAINPLATNVTLEVIANGTPLNQSLEGDGFRTLDKCANWNFTTSTCIDDIWVPYAALSDDGNYYFTINSEDPGFKETVSNCTAEDRATSAGLWNSVCDAPNGSYLQLNDGIVETHETHKQGGTRTYAGVKIQSVNTSITDCLNVTNVEICYEWWVGDSNSEECSIAVNNNTNTSTGAGLIVDSTCPGTTPNPGIMCQNVTANRTWTCGNFFGPNGTRAAAHAEVRRSPSSPNGAWNLSVDILYFNVTYVTSLDNPPTTTLVSPANGNVTTSKDVNFTCNATDDLQLANITFYWNYSGSWQANGTVAVSGTSNQTTFQRTNLSNGAILWNCRVCDNASQCSFAPANRTVTVNYTTPDTEAPQWSNPQKNTTTIYKNDVIRFNTSWADNVGLSAYIFSTNDTGSWVNQSAVSFSGTSNTSTQDYQITASRNTVVGWRFYANDTSNNWNATNIQTFTVSDKVPTSSLNSPSEGYIENTTNTITFNCSATDDYALANITLYGNFTGTWQANGTIAVSGTSNSTTFTRTLANGYYIWNCLASDDAGQTAFATTNRTLTVNYTVPDNPPSLTLSYPPDNYYNDTSQYINLTFNASVTDDYNLVNCSLWHNYTGTWHLNQTQTLTGTNNITNFSLNNLTSKTFIWNIQCYDNVSQSSFATANRTVILNWTAPPNQAPQIILNLPTNNTVFNNIQNINFNFTATDDYNTTLSCSIYLDGTLNQTNNSVQNNTLTNFLITGISYGNHNWSINCSDGSLSNISETRYFSVNDTLKPSVFDLKPIAGSTYDTDTTIEIAANVTDNIAVSSVRANITYPNSTIQQITLNKQGSTDKYNNSFTIPSLIGQYNITIIADDTSNNVNDTEKTWFNAKLPNTAPYNIIINDINGKSNNSSFNTNQSTINFTAYDLENSILICEIYINNTKGYGMNSTTENATPTLIQINQSLNDGPYTTYVNCTDGELSNSSDVWWITIDTIAPEIIVLSPLNQTYNYSLIWFNATANELISKWIVNYNGTNTTLSDINTTLNVSEGSYHLLLYANDSTNNFGLNNTIYFTVDYCTPNLVNTSWSEWQNETCLGNQTNQSRFRVEYDSNNCGEIENKTYYEYQLVGPVYENKSWSDWYNITSCRANDTILQERNRTSYDVYECAANLTFFEYQEIPCDFCTPNPTNSSWSAWANVSCSLDQMNQSRFRTEYDSNFCNETSNITYYEYQLVGPFYTNTSWSSWENITSCQANDTILQSRNLTQYDGYGCASNTTFFEYQEIPCDYCTPSMTNTSWSSWYNLTSCQINDTILQERNLTEYDSNFCGEVSNTTYYEHQEIACNYCSYNVVNSTGAWQNQTSCQVNDTILQNRTITEFDSNYSTCYLVTLLPSDLWNSGNNNTYIEYQEIPCDYCTSNMTNITESWANISECRINDTILQQRNITEYDINNCGEEENVTYTEYQEISCDYCQYNITNITGEWQNMTECQANETILQNRTITEFDSNYSTCYLVTGLPSDLWNSGNNKTYWEYREISCNYNPLINLTGSNATQLNYTSSVIQDYGDGIFDVELNITGEDATRIIINRFNVSGCSDLIFMSETNETWGSADYSISTDCMIFDNITLEIVPATSTHLYKCTDWNVGNQTCNDENSWDVATLLTPGQPYTITITETDAGFIELNLSNVGILNDGYADETAPGTEYGARALLSLENSTGAEIISMVMFNLTLIPGEVIIDSANFSVRCNSETLEGGESIGIGVHLVYNNFSWIEGTGGNGGNACTGNEFCWNYKPLPDYYNSTAESSNSLPDGCAGIFYNFSVTQAVIYAYTNNYKNISLILVPNGTNTGDVSGDSINLNSKEAPNSARVPKLYISYHTIPKVTDVQPVENTQYNQTDIVTISANVTERYPSIANVSVVLANITLPNSTIQQIVLLDENKDNIYEQNFTNTNLIGIYNITIIANNTDGYINDTEKTYFVVQMPNTAPQISLNLPANNTQFNNTQDINFNFTAIDDYNSTLNCSIYLDNVLNQTNNSVQNNTLTNFLITGISYGNHNWSINCSDGSLSNISETRYFSVNDTQSPLIQFVSPTPANNSIIFTDYVYVNVTSNENLDAAILEWNSTNESMSGTGINWYKNKTSLSEGNYTYKVYANDSAGNWNVSEERMITISTSDIVSPIIIINSPTNTTYTNATQLVNISASDPNLDSVWYNWNGTNTTYTNPVYVTFNEGTNTLYAWANDTFGNINSTSVIFFIDTTPPALITNLQNISAGETWIYWNWTNPSDADFDEAIIYINGNNVFNTSDNYYNATSLECDSDYTITVHTKDSLGNINDTDVNNTARTTECISAIINSVAIYPRIIINGSSVELHISASNYDTLWANITLPNSTVRQIILSNNANTTFTETELTGRYDITFYANNTNGSIAYIESYFISAESLLFNLSLINYNSTGIDSSLRIYFLNGTVAYDSSANGNYSLEIPSYIYDLEFKAYNNRLVVYLRDVNISLDTNKNFGMDKLATPASGYLVTYGIENIDDYNFANATLTIYYDELSYNNENNLRLYKCNDWNFTEQTCLGDWTDVTEDATQNIDNHYFEIDVNSFSGFSIKELESVRRHKKVEEKPEEVNETSKVCFTNWTCTEWSSCINGTETRACKKINESCYAAEFKPIEARTCIVPSAVEEEKEIPVAIEKPNLLWKNIIYGIIFLLVICLVILIIIISRKKKKIVKNRISSLIGKNVFTESGIFFGTIEDVILGENRIEWLKVKLEKGLRIDGIARKALVNRSAIISFGDVVMVNKKVLNIMGKHELSFTKHQNRTPNSSVRK